MPHTFTPGCETRKNLGEWVDIVGLMFHHTASDASDAANLSLLIHGRTGLRGPLSNFGEGDDGVTDVIALGPANHAGGGDPKVLSAVRKESYTSYPPTTAKTHGQDGSIGGNSYFYGWEVYYGLGKDKTIDAIQYRGTILSMVAIIDKLDELDTTAKWSSKSIIGHKEWQKYKPDPAGVDMKVARADAQWCLDNGPAAAKHWYKTGSKTMPKPPTPKPKNKEEVSMVFYQIQSDDKRIADPVIVSDGFRMRHLSYLGWVRIKGSIKQQTGVEPVAIGVKDLSGLALEWVGPLPFPEYPLPKDVKVVPSS